MWMELKFKPYSAKLSRKYTYNYTDQRYYTEITTIELAYEYQDSAQGRIINDVVRRYFLYVKRCIESRLS